MRRLLILLPVALSACAAPAGEFGAPRDGCGLLGCISSPHLRARGAGLHGADMARVISVMGGAPNASIELSATERALTWTRTQQDRDFGTLSCSETLIMRGGVVAGHQTRGNCG